MFTFTLCFLFNPPIQWTNYSARRLILSRILNQPVIVITICWPQTIHKTRRLIESFGYWYHFCIGPKWSYKAADTVFVLISKKQNNVLPIILYVPYPGFSMCSFSSFLTFPTFTAWRTTYILFVSEKFFHYHLENPITTLKNHNLFFQSKFFSFFMCSQTCVQRPPKNSGRCWQVVIVVM